MREKEGGLVSNDGDKSTCRVTLPFSTPHLDPQGTTRLHPKTTQINGQSVSWETKEPLKKPHQFYRNRYSHKIKGHVVACCARHTVPYTPA